MTEPTKVSIRRSVTISPHLTVEDLAKAVALVTSEALPTDQISISYSKGQDPREVDTLTIAWSTRRAL